MFQVLRDDGREGTGGGLPEAPRCGSLPRELDPCIDNAVGMLKALIHHGHFIGLGSSAAPVIAVARDNPALIGSGTHSVVLRNLGVDPASDYAVIKLCGITVPEFTDQDRVYVRGIFASCGYFGDALSSTYFNLLMVANQVGRAITIAKPVQHTFDVDDHTIAFHLCPDLSYPTKIVSEAEGFNWSTLANGDELQAATKQYLDGILALKNSGTLHVIGEHGCDTIVDDPEGKDAGLRRSFLRTLFVVVDPDVSREKQHGELIIGDFDHVLIYPKAAPYGA
jgi:hypothetical protein